MTTYQQAGVNIDAAAHFTSLIKERIAAAWPGGAENIGGFASSTAIPKRSQRFSTAADGTGTKAILAAAVERFDGLGQDAVAMSAQDTYVAGLLPVELSDVLDVAKLNPNLHIKIIDSLIAGCQRAGCRLGGGETAELPDMFRQPWMVNINTFVVGFDQQQLVTGTVKPGDQIYGWPSYGPASNGFSLIRKVFNLKGRRRETQQRLLKFWPDLCDQTLADVLLKPTPIWIQQIEIQRIDLGVTFAAHAHITGGGLVDNVPRILPPNCQAIIQRNRWVRPRIFRLIEKHGHVNQAEMDRTFNQGIMVVSIVPAAGQQPTTTPNCIHLGEVQTRPDTEPPVKLIGSYQDE